MQAGTWARVKELLPQALAHATGQREQAAHRLAGHDPRVLEELQSLLSVHQEGLETLPEVQAAFAQAAIEQALAPSWVGRRLGPWRVDSLLARGGMGDVYLARRDDGLFDSRVALKCMRRTAMDAPGLRSRFESERRILSSLDHPNLARIIDGGISADGWPYFVMEYVDGEPLDVHCRRKDLPVPQRLSLFISLCQVVEYIHQQGVVHRDLKFSNILVTREGQLKLVDFGIAKWLQADGAEPATQTATALRPLTLAFASPEQVAGRITTPASDIYSLGVVLYHLVAGTGPYPQVDPDNSYALAAAICEQEVAPPSRAATGLARRHRRQVRGDLDAVVLMALRKEPTHRYASARDLAEDLSRHQQHRPVLARRGAWSYRAGRFLWRHKGRTAAALAAGMALAWALGFGWYNASQAERQRSQAARDRAHARELARMLIFDIGAALERLPGTTAPRKRVLERGLASLQQLATEADNDAELNFEIASALYRIGEGQGRFGDYTAGTAVEADRNLAAAQGLLEAALAGAAPQGALLKDSQRLLATVLGRRSTLSIEEFGDRAAAARMMARKLELAQALADTDAGIDFQHLLANTHNELGWLHDDQPEWFRAETDVALRSLDDLLRRAPTDKGVNSILANVLLARGMHELAYAPGRPGALRAEPFLWRSLSMYLALAARYAGEAEYSLMLAEVESGLGTLLQRLGRQREALNRHHKAIAHLDGLLALEPGNVVYRLERAMKYRDLSITLLAQGDAGEALATARTAAQPLKAIDPAFFQVGRMLQARVRIGYQLARSIEAVQGPAALQACPHWIATQRDLPAFLARAGGLLEGLRPGRVTEAAHACEARGAAAIPAGSD